MQSVFTHTPPTATATPGTPPPPTTTRTTTLTPATPAAAVWQSHAFEKDF